MALSWARESGAVAIARVSFGCVAPRNPESPSEKAFAASRICDARTFFCWMRPRTLRRTRRHGGFEHSIA